MEGPSGGRLRLTCEKYGPHKKYTKLVLLEHETLLLTKCAKPFEEKTFVEALGAKGQANPTCARQGLNKLRKKTYRRALGQMGPRRVFLLVWYGWDTNRFGADRVF